MNILKTTTLFANIIIPFFSPLTQGILYVSSSERNTYNKALGVLRPRPNVELLLISWDWGTEL